MIITVSQVDSLTDEDVEKLFCPQVYLSDKGYGSYTHFGLVPLTFRSPDSFMQPFVQSEQPHLSGPI